MIEGDLSISRWSISVIYGCIIFQNNLCLQGSNQFSFFAAYYTSSFLTSCVFLVLAQISNYLALSVRLTDKLSLYDTRYDNLTPFFTFNYHGGFCISTSFRARHLQKFQPKKKIKNIKKLSVAQIQFELRNGVYFLMPNLIIALFYLSPLSISLFFMLSCP